jgi:hypothetical protein
MQLLIDEHLGRKARRSSSTHLTSAPHGPLAVFFMANGDRLRTETAVKQIRIFMTKTTRLFAINIANNLHIA